MEVYYPLLPGALWHLGHRLSLVLGLGLRLENSVIEFSSSARLRAFTIPELSSLEGKAAKNQLA